MSPKDSPLGGQLPSLTFYDVISKICSSMRAYGCLKHVQERVEKDGSGSGTTMNLALNPWNNTMDTATEFRVFVPSPAACGILEPRINNFKISAISQYKWHSILNLPFDSTLQWVTDRVTEEGLDILADIITYMAADLIIYARWLLLKYGFTFDVAFRQDGKVQLIKLNPFGAMSVCGHVSSIGSLMGDCCMDWRRLSSRWCWKMRSRSC
jgi:hypothetical protein